MYLEPSKVWGVIRSNAIEALKLKTPFRSPSNESKPYEIINVGDDSIRILRVGRKGQPSPCSLTAAHVAKMVGLLNAEGGKLSCEDERLEDSLRQAARTMFARLHPQLRIEKMRRKDGGSSNHIVVVELKPEELILNATSPQLDALVRPTDVIQDLPRTAPNGSVPASDPRQAPHLQIMRAWFWTTPFRRRVIPIT